MEKLKAVGRALFIWFRSLVLLSILGIGINLVFILINLGDIKDAIQGESSLIDLLLEPWLALSILFSVAHVIMAQQQGIMRAANHLVVSSKGSVTRFFVDSFLKRKPDLIVNNQLQGVEELQQFSQKADLLEGLPFLTKIVYKRIAKPLNLFENLSASVTKISENAQAGRDVKTEMIEEVQSWIPDDLISPSLKPVIILFSLNILAMFFV